MSTVLGAADNRILEMDPGGDAFLTVNTDSVTSSPVGIHTVNVLLSRNKNIYDTET